MTLHRYAARRDDSEPEVVEAFLDGGATVIKHSGPSEADLLVAYKGRWHAVEVKTGNEPLREDQRKWAERMAAPVEVCRNGQQARVLLAKWDRDVAHASRLEALAEER